MKLVASLLVALVLSLGVLTGALALLHIDPGAKQDTVDGGKSSCRRTIPMANVNAVTRPRAGRRRRRLRGASGHEREEKQAK